MIKCCHCEKVLKFPVYVYDNFDKPIRNEAYCDWQCIVSYKRSNKND